MRRAILTSSGTASTIAFGAAHCVECHAASTEAVERYAETGVKPMLVGGQRFAAPPLGAIYSKNLTPDPETGIGRYTDPQIARMLRYAVRPDGRASVQPVMRFGGMSDDDIVAVISFLRTQPPVRNVVPKDEWQLAGKIVKSLAPPFKPRWSARAPASAPRQAPTAARGEYVARSLGNCEGCHSPLNDLTFEVNGPPFSGGAPQEPRNVAGVDRQIWFQPPNLTPFRGSALLRFPDRETFVARFQRGGRKYQASPMPWECFGHLAAEDAARFTSSSARCLPPANRLRKSRPSGTKASGTLFPGGEVGDDRAHLLVVQLTAVRRHRRTGVDGVGLDDPAAQPRGVVFRAGVRADPARWPIRRRPRRLQSRGTARIRCRIPWPRPSSLSGPRAPERLRGACACS